MPLEIITSAGYRPFRLIGRMDRCCQEETGLSRNVCPYMHGVLRSFRDFKDRIARAVLTDSCDAMKKVSDILALESFPVAMLSVPRKQTEEASAFFALQLEHLYRELCKERNILPDPERVREHISRYDKVRELLEEIRENGLLPSYADFFSLKQKVLQSSPDDGIHALRKVIRKNSGRSTDNTKEHENTIPVIITGSPVSGEQVFRIIEDAGFTIVYNDSCLDTRWLDRRLEPTVSDNPFKDLSRIYLSRTPCARMHDRKTELDAMGARYSREVKGIIHFRMPFCDLYGFDLVHLMSNLGKEAVLPIEADGSQQSEGQIKTRVQAFAEMIKSAKQREPGGQLNASLPPHNIWVKGPVKSAKQREPGGPVKNRGVSVRRTSVKKERYYCGIDIGSTTVDGVIIDGGGNILCHRIMKTGPRADKASHTMLQQMVNEVSLTIEEIERIVATGYGRESLSFAQDTVTEISCHAKGVRHLLPETRFVVDIGGQDSKVIKIDDTGKVQDFQMNDKCAAGTGRFLEVMAHSLEVDISAMSDLSLEKGEIVPISSVCTVFAESEVISLLGKGYEPSSIVKGIYRSITNRIEGMVRRVGPVEPAAITGGGALNRGLVRHLEERAGLSFTSPDIPQIVGAVGAALYAREHN